VQLLKWENNLLAISSASSAKEFHKIRRAPLAGVDVGVAEGQGKKKADLVCRSWLEERGK